MDFPSIKVRLLGSPTAGFPYGFTGFLHWGGNYWTVAATPRHAARNRQEHRASAAGDAFIACADRGHLTVRSSIRLESMRAGIAGLEDYEMLRALKGRDPAAAERTAAGAVSSFTDCVSDVASFRKIEQRLLEALSRK